MNILMHLNCPSHNHIWCLQTCLHYHSLTPWHHSNTSHIHIFKHACIFHTQANTNASDHWIYVFHMKCNTHFSFLRYRRVLDTPRTLRRGLNQCSMLLVLFLTLLTKRNHSSKYHVIINTKNMHHKQESTPYI